MILGVKSKPLQVGVGDFDYGNNGHRWTGLLHHTGFILLGSAVYRIKISIHSKPVVSAGSENFCSSHWLNVMKIKIEIVGNVKIILVHTYICGGTVKKFKLIG
ncbi:UNVERIFIED_CONTAM: hypothetical protein K2H54_018747 [Gekko kuhli]